MIIGLCQRFHCLPSQLKHEDMSLLRMVRIVEAAYPDKDEFDA